MAEPAERTKHLLSQTFTNIRNHWLKVLHELIDRVLFLDYLPQLTRLHEILVSNLGRFDDNLTLPLFVVGELIPLAESYGSDLRADIIWITAVVPIDATRSVTFIG